MSKHHRTAGADYREVEILGKKYKFRPLRVGAYAEMESYIVSRRPDPLLVASEAVRKLPPSQHDAVWKAAMCQAVAGRTVTAEEAACFENSVDGLAWKVWLCLHENHPEIDSPEAAKDWLIQAGQEHFEYIFRSVEIANGEADIKKSSGQTAEAEADPVGQSSTEN